MKTLRVLIIDDSALVRKVLREVLEKAGGFEVVDTAMDPVFAVEKIKRLKPDVLTLDLEMPRMDGLTFLGRLMRSMPIPTVIVSSLAQRGADVTLRALELGAFDFVLKPQDATQLSELSAELATKLRGAALAGVATTAHPAPLPTVDGAAKEKAHAIFSRLTRTTDKLIAIGASTGGTVAIESVLSMLPADSPGIVIVQHMPPVYTKSFAARLDQICKLYVKEAEEGDTITPGHVYIAPGNFHLTLVASGATWVCRLNQEPPQNYHRPSVDVLFHSVAQVVGRNAYGIMLTGMGDDGAKGMREMRDNGAWNVVQDEASSVVFGMPKKAIDAGAADVVAPLSEIPARLLARIKGEP